jgi:thymidylate synthase
LEQAKLQLQRTPRNPPQLHLKQFRPSILDYEFEDIELADYNPHPHIAAPVAV